MVRSITRTMALVAGLVGLSGCDPRVDYTQVPVGIGVSSTNVTPIGILGGPAVVSQVVIVAATAGQVSNLAATIVYGSGAAGWLTATLDRTTVSQDQPANLTLAAVPGPRPLGPYTATVVLSADNLPQPVVLAVRFTIDPRPPVRIAIATQPAGPVVNGTQLPQQPAVQLFNDQNQPATVANVVVTAGLASGGGQLTGGVTASTDGNGRAVFAGLVMLGTAGPKTLSFSAPNLASVISAPVTLVAGGATQLVAVSAVTQSANAGTAVATLPQVRVVDQSGNGVAGFTVGFAASAASVIVPATSAVSGADGIAQLSAWTLNPVAGPNSVTATANGLAGSPITFTATGQVGPATIFAKQSGDNLIGLISNPLGTPHVVKVADAFGNGVALVSVTWGVTGGGSVAPASSVTGANGSTQAIRTLGAAAGPVTTTATATVGGTPITVVFAVTAALAGPTQIVKVDGDAQTGPVTTTLPVPIQVQVLDAINTPQPNVLVTFTTLGPGGSFPGGVVIATDANGLASTTWKLGTVAGAQTAQAAVGGPAPAVFTATAAPGAVSAPISTVAASPTSITAGSGVSTITVTAKDVNGNAIPGQAVSLGLVGAATLSANAGTTNGAGQMTATLTGTVAGAQVVSASIAGVAISQSATVTIVAAAPATMTAVTPIAFPVRFGQAVATVPRVLVLDQFSNPVGSVSVTFGITSGQSTLGSTFTATASDGTASPATWVVAALFAGPLESDVYNRVVAASGVLTPITFTGTATVSHSADLMPMYSGFCSGCHVGQAPNFSLSSAGVYGQLVTVGQRYVIPSDSTSFPGAPVNKNLLIYWPRPGGGVHSGGDYTAKLATIVKAWVRQGAIQN